ncbi:MAG TPA: signal peptide peptidase SppA [Myxococcaceae bacterium]|nr:signal peptide peptidase SppA [Myxococcaceae bacterium]
MSRLAASLLLLVPFLAHAQASSIGELRPTLPPTNAALADEITAPEVNPAGLQFIGGPMFVYQHERNLEADSIVDGVYFGSTFFDWVGFGVGLDWVRGPPLGSERSGYRKSSYTFSLGGQWLSAGTTFNVLTPNLGTAPGPNTWDLGLASRPSRWLALGLALKDVGNEAQTRTWELAFGVRPWGDWLTLGANWQFPGFDTFGQSRIGAVVQAEVVRGVVLGSSVTKSWREPGEPWFWQVSLTLNTDHAGLSYALGGGPDGTDHVIQARLSASRYRGIDVFGGRVGLVDLSAALTESGSALGLFGIRGEDPYLRLLRRLQRAAEDRTLAGLVVKIERLPIGMGEAEELRAELLRLRKAGKRVAAVLLSGGDKEYLVATGADRIWVAPQSFLAINGLSASVIFLGETMEKLGIRWDVARVGAYKNLPDQLTRASMSPEQRESLDAFLDTEVRRYEGLVADSRALAPDRFRKVLEEGLLPPRLAVREKLADDVVDPAQLDRVGAALVPDGRWVGPYWPPQPERRWGEPRRIAVVPVIGSITAGRSRSDPLGFSRSAGSDTIEKALRDAESDPRVAAIVVRVDSGGGDGLASDIIYRAVLRARTRKPVVASMGGVAASGGYYAAMGADWVLAEPTTLTGSIGVFVLKPGLEGLGKKLGVNVETLKRAPLSEILGFYKPWTPAEQAAAQRWVDAFYDDFVKEVARSRKLDSARVDAVARGRIWSGEDAKARGLVDALGGLPEAIAEARRRAGVPEQEELALVTYGGPVGLFAALAGEDGVLTQLGATGEREAPEPEALQRLAHEVGAPSLFLLEPGLKAALPFEYRVQ